MEGQRGVLCGEGLVVHEEEVDVTGCDSLVVGLWTADGRLRTVVDDESLVAGRHEVTGLLVGSVTDLSRDFVSQSSKTGDPALVAFQCQLFPSELRIAMGSVPWA